MSSTWLRRLGLPGLLALALLAAAAWGQWRWLPQQRAEADQLGSDARRMRHELLALQAPGAPASIPSGQAGAELAWSQAWQQLPPADDRARLQAQVLASATKAGLKLSAVQWRGEAAGVPRVWRQRLVLPVEGRYDQVRAWLAALLAEQALSVDSVDVQRSDVMSDVVKARVGVSLWWRQTAGRP